MTPRAIAVVAVVAVTACSLDNGAPSHQDELVGTWISAGSDVAIGLTSTARAAGVRATFEADSTYVIEIADSTDGMTRQSGMWSASAGRDVARAITLYQTLPSPRVEQGVFLVSGARLTYEVVPVQPADAGLSPPTIASGFGSTTQHGNARGSTWIQRFWSAGVAVLTPPCNPNDSLSALSKRPCDGHQWTAETPKR